MHALALFVVLHVEFLIILSFRTRQRKSTIGISIAAVAVLLLLAGGGLVLLCVLKKKKSADKGYIYVLIVIRFSRSNSTGTKKKGLAAYSAVRGGHLLDEGVAYFISLPILEGATDNFSKRAGKGSFGSVYYG
ncbi:unnamed protein product, partial [Brassica oleracea]